MNEFYIGYLPKAPSALSRFVRRVVIALGLLASSLALVMVRGQRPFAASTFEYGKLRTFEGIIEAKPYPMLLVVRPGDTGQKDKYSRYLLVAPGKHGADTLVSGLDGKRVHIQGQLIYRSGGTMVEIEPGSLTVQETIRSPQVTTRYLGEVTLTGEIVDSKCYLGVMNPGQGKVHRDCAARCLSGGIPPLFITSDRGEQFLLVDLEGRPLDHPALREFVSEPITIRGELLEAGGTRQLKIDTSTIRHTSQRASLEPIQAHK
jgi:hypothetical protein